MAKKYIDAEKLKAEIDKRYAEYLAKMKNDNFTYYEGMADALDLFEQFIDSLQQEQPEVDLEKEINIEISKWACYEEIGFGARYDAKPFDGRDIEKIARHFYELGLNARKEK